MMVMLAVQAHHLWGLLTLSHMIIGSRKSIGMKPIAPTRATKSPKKGINAARKVMMTLYTRVMQNRANRLRLLRRDWRTSQNFISKYSYVGRQYTCSAPFPVCRSIGSGKTVWPYKQEPLMCSQTS